MAAATRERRLVFGEVAETYDEVRPTYPDALYEDVVRFGGLEPGQRALEIGCGTGKATLPFARRGLRIAAVEPNAAMATVARRNYADFPDVEVHEATFEAWPFEPGSYDLAYAAQSIHWIPPEVRYTRSARALRPGGTLAVFGHAPQCGDAPIHREIEAAYAARASDFAGRLPGQTASFPAEGDPVEHIDATGAFGTVFQARYRWHADYDTQRYVRLLETQSDHRLLAEQARAALLAAIGAAIERHGGSVRIEYTTHLLLARRREEIDG